MKPETKKATISVILVLLNFALVGALYAADPILIALAILPLMLSNAFIKGMYS
jgi:hypothetical protein